MDTLHESTLYKRLQREKAMLPADIEVEEVIPEKPTYDKYFCWKLRVPYKNTTYLLIVLTFPKLYPFKEPDIKIPEPTGILDGICRCHGSDGTLCVSGFLDAWSPTWTVARIVERLLSLLDSKRSHDGL